MRTTQKQFSIRTALLFFVMACAAYGADRMYGTNRMDGDQVKLCPTCKVVLYKDSRW